MRPEFAPAIDALERDLADLERKANETRVAINTLCRHAGMPPRYPEGGGGGSKSKPLSQIRSDTFYGKKMSTAAREYLDMRRASDLGPAKPREVFDALTKGGYTFGAKDDNTALTILRATMRKNSTTFHRLPDGSYGLLAWYPDAKPTKQGEPSTSRDEEDATEADVDADDELETMLDDPEEPKAKGSAA